MKLAARCSAFSALGASAECPSCPWQQARSASLPLWPVATAIAVGSPTVHQGILSSVSGWVDFLKELKFKGKKAAVFGCYGWSGEGNTVLRKLLTEAGFETVEPEIKCSWNPRPEDLEKAKDIAKALLG